MAALSPRTLDELLAAARVREKVEVYRGRSLSKVEFKKTDRLTDSLQPVAGPTPSVPVTQTQPVSVPVATPKSTNIH